MGTVVSLIVHIHQIKEIKSPYNIFEPREKYIKQTIPNTLSIQKCKIESPLLSK